LITIGITCYNEGDWLLECWQSVLAQTDNRWTAVLVMDGTTHQRTREIFDQLNHPQLRKFAMPTNVGPYPTRNKAFELTETTYHFYLDGDDQLLPDSVKLVLDGFSSHPDAPYVYGDYITFGSSEGIKRFPAEYNRKNFVEGITPPGACAYQKITWEKLGGFAQELARGPADYDFHIGIAESGGRGWHCGAPFYRCRKGHESVTSSYALRRHEMHEIIVRRHPDFFTAPQRNRFLSLGYKRAAYANQVAGNVAKASELSRLALKHGMWSDLKLWRMAMRGSPRRAEPVAQP
jgi:glycosyltransferase involved in cell wall biosynthesis